MAETSVSVLIDGGDELPLDVDEREREGGGKQYVLGFCKI